MSTSDTTIRGTSYRSLKRWRKAHVEAGSTIQAERYEAEITRRRLKALVRVTSLVLAACTGAFVILWTSTVSGLHDHYWAAAAATLTVLAAWAERRL